MQSAELDEAKALFLKENCNMPYFFGPNGTVVGVDTISIKRSQCC